MKNTSSLAIPRLPLLLFLLLGIASPVQPPPSPGQNFVRMEVPRVRVSSDSKPYGLYRKIETFTLYNLKTATKR